MKNVKTGLILATAYFIAGKFGLLFMISGGYASPLFPSTGIALAFLLTYGEGMIGWIFVGTFALITSSIPLDEALKASLKTSGCISAASALQTYFTVKLIRIFIGKNLVFESLEEVFLFVFAVVLGCITSASLSTLVLLYGNHLQTENLIFSWLTWWFGDALGMVLITPLVLTIIGEPKEIWHVRRRMLFIVVIVGIVFISAVERIVVNWEQEKNLTEFQNLSENVSERITSNFSLEEAFVDQLATLMGGSNQISAEEFENFAKVGLARFNYTVKAVEWAPLIKNENRKSFEFKLKQKFSNFQINERDSEEKIVTAKLRKDYVPVTYIYPLNGNIAAVGYDLSSNSKRNEAINNSNILHQPVATAPIKLVQETGNQAGILLVHWVSGGANGPGLVLVVMRMGDFMDYVINNSKSLVNIRLVDQVDNKQIYDSINDDSRNIIYDKLISFGHRSYRISATPTSSYLSQHRNWQTWSITFCGLAFVSGLSMTLLLISARTMRIENLASDNEQRWALAVSGANDGIWDWNLKTNEAYFSERFKSMLGFSDEEIRPHIDDWVALVHPDDIKDTMLAMQKHFDGESQFYERELRIRCKNGEYKWILCRGRALIENDKPIRMVGSHTDVTSRRVAEAGIRDQAQQLDAIFKLSPDGFVAFDNKRVVKYVSPAFLLMTGLDQDSAIGCNEESLSKLIADICIPKARFSGISALRNLLKAKKKGSDDPLLRIELSNSNTVIDVGLKEGTSDSVSQILYCRDITHESEVDRMKSEFLSTAAHELRTPMSSIYGFSELLLTQEFETVERNEFISTIYEQSKLMVSIINELLDLARIDARRGKDFILSNFKITELIAETIVGYKIPNGRIATKFSKGEDVALIVSADRNKLRQALNNILSNAYKYSPDGGEVCVEIIHSSKNQQISSGKSGRMIGIRIEDHGIGMTPDQVSRVFERFYRADTSGKIAGTGLGLSIVKEIIELHHGSIQVESVYSHGTTVTIWLPVSSTIKYVPHAKSQQALFKYRPNNSRAKEALNDL